MAIAISIIAEGATAIGEGLGLMEGGAALTGGGLAAGGIISQQQRQRSGGLVPSINHHQRQAQWEQNNALRNINFDNIRNALSPITQPIQPDEQMAPLPKTDFPDRSKEIQKENKKRGRPKKQPVQEEQKQNINTGDDIIISEEEYQQAYQSQSIESLQYLLDQLQSEEESKNQFDNENMQRQIKVVKGLIHQKQVSQQEQQQIIQDNNEEMNDEETHFEFQPMNEEDEKIDIDESNQRPSDIKRGHTGGNPDGDEPPNGGGGNDPDPNAGDRRLMEWIKKAQKWLGYIPNMDHVLKAYEEHQKNKTEKSREDLIKRFEKLDIDELERISKQAHKFDEFDIEGDLLEEK